MTIRASVTRSGTTAGRVAPSEPNLVRFVTPYLQVEGQSISSLERTIQQELGEVKHAARRRRKDGAGVVIASRKARA